eukprot:1452371-Pyramimonas_sp.AAC.1
MSARSVLVPAPQISSHSSPIWTTRKRCAPSVRNWASRIGPNTAPSRGCGNRGSVLCTAANHLARAS